VEAALAAIRTWQPYDGHAWLDDVGNVLGSVPQAESRMDELAHAVREGEAAVIPARGVYRWHLDVNVK